jgi:outer membrane protease
VFRGNWLCLNRLKGNGKRTNWGHNNENKKRTQVDWKSNPYVIIKGEYNRVGKGKLWFIETKGK